MRLVWPRVTWIGCLGPVFLVAIAVTVSVQAAPDLAAAQLDELGNDVLSGLEHVNEFLKGGQWDESVETLRRLMEDRGDRLIQIPIAPQWSAQGFATFVPLREYCQMQLAAWRERAPEALAVYRRRVDAIAARWYSEAVDEQSEAKLRRIVDELFVSSVGDEALLRLGEMALERGNCTLARRSWEQISPQLRTTPAAAHLLGCPSGCSWWSALRGRDLDSLWSRLEPAIRQQGDVGIGLAYPDSDISLAKVRACLVLVSILEDARDRAATEWELLRRLHPDAEGRMGGRTGKYWELVEAMLRDAESWPRAAKPFGWTTFSGSPQRNTVVDQGVDVARRVVWRTSLPRLEDSGDRVGAGRTRVAEQADGLLSYHPAIIDDTVLIRQPGSIRAIRLFDGQPSWPVETVSSVGVGERDVIYRWSDSPSDVIPRRSAHAGVPRYCVTVDGERLFARMGTAWTGSGSAVVLRPEQRSFLVGIDLRTQKLLFDRIMPSEGWEFEAAPIADRAHLYASLRRRDSSSAQARVACYSVETGRLLWETDVVRAETIVNVLFELPNSALALHDDLLFYNTSLGATAALQVDDGRVQWVCRYRRSGLTDNDPDRNDRHCFRDLTPCLVHAGQVITAAADCDRIFTVEAGVGRVVWATGAGIAVDAVHLLGVGQGHLLASGDYLYWIDVWSGRLVGQFPAPRGSSVGFAGPDPRGYGRGILAGDHVYWPTRDRIFVFDQLVPRHVRQPIDLVTLGITGGNLLISDGMLLIASPNELVALNQLGRPVDRMTNAASR